jgi:flagellar hook-length control protein FliK
MTIQSFFTLQIQTPGAKPATGHQALGGNALQGLNFIDFILAQLAQKAEKENQSAGAGSDEKAPLQSENPLLNKKAGLDLTQLLSATSEIAQEAQEEGFAEDPEGLMQILALNQKAFDEILKPLVDSGVIAPDATQAEKMKVLNTFLVDGNMLDEETLTKLKDALTQIEGVTAEDGSPVFVASNLTLEQITELKVRIEKILKGETPEQASEIIVGNVKIVAPQDIEMKKSDELSASLNKLIAGTDEESHASFDTNTDADPQTPEEIIKQFSKKTPAESSIGENTKTKTPSVKPDLSTLQGWQFPNAPGSFYVMSGLSEGGDQLAVMGQNLQFPAMAQALSLATQAHGASAPHPATQMVAATIQKAVSDGESRNIIMQLDPPELGRVEVRLSFSKDKTVKAVLVAEKADTYAMLQRDAHLLERALENAGLDADGSSLSFELAQEGYDFNHNGGHDDYAGNGSGNASGDETEEFIQSTMTWHVDPDTGHMRYNILA